MTNPKVTTTTRSRVRFANNNNNITMNGSCCSSVRTAAMAAVSDVWVFSPRDAPSAPKQHNILRNQPIRKRFLLDTILGDDISCFRQNEEGLYQLLYAPIDTYESYDDGGVRVVLKSFLHVQDILRFMLQHGIPHADRLSPNAREQLTRAVMFCHVPYQDFRNAQTGRGGFRPSDARILSSDDEIVALLGKVGFVFVDSYGKPISNRKLSADFAPSKVARIFAPGYFRNGGSGDNASITSFTSLDQVRVFVRHERNVNTNRVLSNHLEQRLQMLALRVWGATAPVPLPTFCWDRFGAVQSNENWQPTPRDLLCWWQTSACRSIVSPTGILKTSMRYSTTATGRSCSLSSALLSSAMSRAPLGDKQERMPTRQQQQQLASSRDMEAAKSALQQNKRLDVENHHHDRFSNENLEN